MILTLLLWHPLLLSAQSVTILNGGRECISAGATVTLPAVIVQSGGSLVFEGTGTTTAKMVGAISGAPITVQAGGMLDLRHALIQNLSTITINAGAMFLRAKDVVFEDLASMSPPPSGIPWLDLSALTASDRDGLPFSLNRISFNLVGGTRTNIKAGANTPLVRVLGNAAVGGNRWGEANDDDDANRLLWHTGAVVRSDAAVFDTLEDALKASGTSSGSVLSVTLGSSAFLDDVVDFATTQGGANATGPVIRNANLAPLIGSTVLDSDGDSGRRGKLINCVIARGSVDETSSENCTFFDPRGASTLAVTNITSSNGLWESGAPGGNNINATAGFFASAATYDFHLVSPGGNAAIDEGAALTEPTDFEGQARGAYGKPGGSGTWDIGADECPTPVVTTLAHLTRDATPVIRASGTDGFSLAFFRDGIFLGTAVVVAGIATFNDPSGQADGTYTYTAAYSFGSGLYSGISTNNAAITIDTIPPTAPAKVWATEYATCVFVEWAPSPPGEGVAGYRVQRSTWSGSAWSAWTTLTSGGLVTGTKYRDNAIVSGTRYRYQIIAVDSALPE